MVAAWLFVCCAALSDRASLTAFESVLPSLPPPRPAFATQRPAVMTVVDAQGLDLDRNLTLLALQGLVNRRAPRLFVVGMNEFNRDADRFWVERLERLYGTRADETDFEGALRKYGPELRGLLMYPVDSSQSENVACMAGALLDMLPVAPEVRDQVAGATGLSVQHDLSECFPDRLAAARWASEHLAPKLQPLDLVCLDDRSSLLIRDYAVMRGAFIAGLSSAPGYPEENALRAEISALLPPDAIQWGWQCRDGEGEHVAFGSKHGLRTLCSTNSPNLSFLSQIRPLKATLPKRAIVPAPAVQPKVYLSFVLSDGDSIPILLTRQWYRWDEEARGQVPFGWEMQPLLNRIAPVVQEYYFESATAQDEFILGPSGAGYCHPSSLPDPGAFFEETRRGVRELSAPVVGVLEDGVSAKSAAFISQGVPNARGLFHGWGGIPTARPIFGRGKPHMPYRLCPPSPEGPKDGAYYAKVADEIRRIAEMDGLPCCIPAHLSCYWSGPDDVPKIMEALGDSLPAEVVLPSALVELAGRIYRDRVFLALPETLQAIRGLGYTVPVTLDSTREKPASVRVVIEPLGPARKLTTLTVSVPPQGQAVEPVRLAAPADEPQTRVRVALLAEGWEPTVREVPVTLVPAPGRIPEGFDTVQSVWEAETLAHNHGHEVADREAYNGTAWTAVEGTDTAEGTTIWGPYEPLQPGSYAVAFRCRTTTPGDRPLARLDCYDYARSQQGLDGVLAERSLSPTDLPGDGSYTDVWLAFELAEPARVEYRLAWTGHGAVTTDRVVVLRRG